MIYLDHAATTPVAPKVAAAMQPYLSERYGNPSSIHALGRGSRAALDTARDIIAGAIHAEYGEIYFTSSGTEADNLALTGVMLAAPENRRHLVISSIEHHAVIHTATALEKAGFEVTRLPVDGEGFVDPDDLRRAVNERTALVSIVHGNNEIGTIQDVARLSKIAHESGALVHTDVVQSFGALPIHVGGMGCDLLSMSAHKIYGPKGVGALYIRPGTKVSPIIWGGSQEREKRAGTENVAGIVGFGKAVELILESREEESRRLSSLRDYFIDKLSSEIPDIRLNGPRKNRLPNNVNISISGVDGAAVLMMLDRSCIAASSGSACSSGSIEPSHVLKAIGLSAELAASGVRFSLGNGTTQSEIESVAWILQGIVTRLRG
jgi:cysteine desulfurase